MLRCAFALKTLLLSIGTLLVLSAPSFAQTPRVLATGESHDRASGLAGGVQGGYNWQSGAAVFGFEADYSAVDLKTEMQSGFRCLTRACSFFIPQQPTAYASSNIDWYGTIRGRLGWTNGPILFYGTGGLAYGKADLVSNFSMVGLSSNLQASATKTGWVGGGGIEYMLQPNVVLNLSYQYVDLGTIDVATPFQRHSCCSNFLTQSATAHARFQVATLGLNWKFAPVDATGKSWGGGYVGGHAGIAWGDKTNASDTAYFFSCFTGTTQVLMADGTSRAISEVKVGDRVLGENGAINRVVEIETPALGTRKLYAFNGGPAFVTPEHPFMTQAGWKSMSPEATFAENNNFAVGALEIGDRLVKVEAITTRVAPMTVALGDTSRAPSAEVHIETVFSPLQSAVPHDGDPSMTVYNLRLDGNHTYFADSYLVHNK